MAKYWDVKYHEDTTEKHDITKEEVTDINVRMTRTI